MTKLFVLVVLAGCGTTVSATMINQPPHPMRPRPAHTVELFTSAPPQRPYVDVAYLEAEQDSDMSVDGTAEFFAKLRQRAGAMGCDGVVIGHPTNRVTSSVMELSNVLTPNNPTDFGPQNLRGLTATCIVYIEHAAPVAPTTPATSSPTATVVTKP